MQTTPNERGWAALVASPVVTPSVWCEKNGRCAHFIGRQDEAHADSQRVCGTPHVRNNPSPCRGSPDQNHLTRKASHENNHGTGPDQGGSLLSHEEERRAAVQLSTAQPILQHYGGAVTKAIVIEVDFHLN